VIAAAITKGEVCIRDFSLETVQTDVSYLRAAGIDIFEWGGHVFASARRHGLVPFDLFTGPYPGVNSDMQPLFAVLATQCHGESSITDQRFTERLQYATELKKLGSSIDAYGNCAVIQGPALLHGTRVKALDLRCGAALAVAACAAEGETVIERADQIERGYEDLPLKLSELGGQIVREPSS